jgi:WD40 repeat protein
LSGGSLGLLYTLKPNNVDQGFDGSEIAGDDAINAICLNPSEDLVAIGGNDSVCLRCYPDAKIVTMTHIARRNLPVTALQFTASGNNL